MEEVKALIGVATKTISDTTIFDDIKNKINKTYFALKLSDEAIHKLLYNYMISTYNKCSSVITIINLNKSISLKSIYEPIILRRVTSNFTNDITTPMEYIDFNDIIDLYLNKNIIIQDTAGMGKTTFSKILVLEILRKENLRKFPLFIELRKIKLNQSIKNYILEEINHTVKDKIKLDLLEHLIYKNIFVFILDGFDEINEENKQHISQEIYHLTNSQANNIILTSRKQENLPKIYKQTIYEFKYLTKQNVINILKKLDNSYSLDAGSKLISHENFNNLDFSLFQTPLMVNLLYVYFTYTHDVNTNIINFYDELFSALFKGHDLTKESFKRKLKSNLNILEFRNLFNAFCFVSIYSETTYYTSESEILKSLKKAIEISKIKINSIDDFLDDLLVHVPLLVKEGNEYKFVHKTILEYFATEFLNTSTLNLKAFKLIRDNYKQLQFKKCFEFLYQLNYNLFLKEVGIYFLNDYLSFYNENKGKSDLLIQLLFLFPHTKIKFIKFSANKFENRNNFEDQFLIKNPNYSNTSTYVNERIVFFFGSRNEYFNFLPIPFIQSIQSKNNVSNNINIDLEKNNVSNNINIDLEENKLYTLDNNILENQIVKDNLIRLKNRTYSPDIKRRLLTENSVDLDLTKIKELIDSFTNLENTLDQLDSLC